MTDSRPQTDDQGGEVHTSLSHVMPLSLLFGIFAVLVLLTLLTVVAAQVSLGAWEVWVSLSIATLKAALVAIYFMHLRYDRPFNTVVFLSAIVFVALFLALTLMDVKV